jgi:hypothetical protein
VIGSSRDRATAMMATLLQALRPHAQLASRL